MKIIRKLFGLDKPSKPIAEEVDGEIVAPDGQPTTNTTWSEGGLDE
jgi:hypothetical protein